MMTTSQTCLTKATDEELLSAFLPSSTVKELVAEYGTVSKMLINAYPDELQKLPGVGPIKARQLQYVLELSRRLYRASAKLPPSIRSPQDVADRMADMLHLAQEEFRALFLNTKNGVIAERIITKGTINASLVAPREVFHRAVKIMAASVILVHNHPSGDPTPSNEDIELTRRMVEAGKVMDIPVFDHVIIGQAGYESLKERGVM